MHPTTSNADNITFTVCPYSNLLETGMKGIPFRVGTEHLRGKYAQSPTSSQNAITLNTNPFFITSHKIGTSPSIAKIKHLTSLNIAQSVSRPSLVSAAAIRFTRTCSVSRLLFSGDFSTCVSAFVGCSDTSAPMIASSLLGVAGMGLSVWELPDPSESLEIVEASLERVALFCLHFGRIYTLPSGWIE